MRYELAERRKARVNIDYHIAYDSRYYSVPHQLVHQPVEVRATGGTIEVFLGGERLATHRRSYAPRGAAVTDAAHRPANHRDQVWPPERLIGWGAKYGPRCGEAGRVDAEALRESGAGLSGVSWIDANG